MTDLMEEIEDEWKHQYARSFDTVDGGIAANLLDRIRNALEAKDARIAELEAALKRVLDDIADYESVNNLSPSPGKQDCWESVRAARAALQNKEADYVWDGDKWIYAPWNKGEKDD